jgi:hypothetical protein
VLQEYLRLFRTHKATALEFLDPARADGYSDEAGRLFNLIVPPECE